MFAYDAFNIIVHGTLMVCFEKQQTTIVVPYEKCHLFYAASLNKDGSPVSIWELQRGDYQIPNLSSAGGPFMNTPDSDHLALGIKGMGSNVFATISGLPPLPYPVSAWGRFAVPILNANCNAYKNNCLDKVDSAGVPSIYVLQFGPQQTAALQMTGGGQSHPIYPTVGSTGRRVGRLHIYAEACVDDPGHNALPSLNASMEPQQDLDAAGSMVKPDLTKPFGCDSVEINEQQPLNTIISCTPPSTCLDMKSSGRISNSLLGGPRTCIPVIGQVTS